MNGLFPARTKAASLWSPVLQLLSASTVTSSSSQRPRVSPILQNAPNIAPTSQTRWASRKRIQNLVPNPTPFVPDVKTFLTLIGRDLHKHEEKFPSWEALFTLNSDQLEELGIDPARTRKYLINWRHKFRNGHFGPGGDAVFVKEGKAVIRVLEVERKDPRLPPARVAMNVPEGKDPKELQPSQMSRVKGYRVRKANIITGPYAIPMRSDLGGGAYLEPKMGMWEHKKGHKIDGGERRRTEVRFLKRVSQRREKREERLAQR
ncbi:hypothetical protein MKZ38_005257 [Zalerion maritima]|uniref:Small ribosomal subunit protein mS41 n=1 Tax=Zalerion maritima TaxID=339359 RepID=A0AAD5RLC8_9PEZI|nr:hypothetical protein MKZ38_005257 [Zalerion maritima]